VFAPNRTFATLIATTAAFALSAGAAQAQSWELPATTLAPYVDGTSDVSVALDGDGDGTAVWGSRPDDGFPGQNIWTSTRPAGGSWQARSLVWAGQYAVDPLVATDSAGNGVVAWLGDAVDAEENVHVASRSGATGAWDGATDLEAAGADQFVPQVAVNDHGDALVSWVERDETTGDTYVRLSARVGGAWSTPVTLSDPSEYRVFLDTPAQIELDAAGRAHVLWLAENTADATFHVQESRFDGTGWSVAQNIATSVQYIHGLEVAGDGAGRVVAAWGLGIPQVIRSGVFSDGDWMRSDVTNDVVASCDPPIGVSAGADGTANVAWLANSSGGVSTVTGTAGAWGAPTPVYAPPAGTYVDEITLGQFPGREPVIVWTTSSNDELYGAMGSRRTASGWQQATPFATAGGRGFSRPSVAMDPSGNVLAGWSVYQSYWAKVQVTGAPGSAPQAPSVPEPPATSTGARPLDPPFVKVRGGVLRMPRRGRVVHARLVNREATPLSGTARLIHFYGRVDRSGSPMRRIAAQRRVRVKVKGHSTLRLRLNDEAMRRLRAAPRHSYPVRLYLRWRTSDGRKVRTTTTFTLDAWNRFGTGRRPPVARKSC
jgi:hypothetical protein